MKLNLNNGFRLSAAILMIVAGTSMAFAQRAERAEKDRDGVKNSEALSDLNKDTKNGTSETRAKSKRLSGQTQKTDLLLGKKEAFDPHAALKHKGDAGMARQDAAIENYLGRANSAAKSDAQVASMITEIRSSKQKILSSSMSPEAKLERMIMLEVVANSFVSQPSGSSVFSIDGLRMFRAMSHGLEANSADERSKEIRDLYSKALVTLEKAKNSSSDKSESGTAAFSNAKSEDIAEALVKVSNELIKDRSKADPSKLSSADDRAAIDGALKNVQSIMEKFEKNMAGGRTTVKLAMLQAVLDWARENHKDYNKAVSCIFNPKSV